MGASEEFGVTGDERWLTVDLPNERVLEVAIAGPTEGMPLLFQNGTPSASHIFAPMVEAAAERGLRTVVYSRPGYGGSTAHRGRSVAHAAADIAAVLDTLGAESFVTIGWSGGGPHALACAALLADRCAAAVSLSGVAPHPAEGLDWMAGMGPENVQEFSLALQGETTLTPWLEEQARALSAIQGPDVAVALGGLVSDVDKAALTGEFADFIAASLRRSVSTGVAGWRDDDLAFTRPWGFDLATIERPVSVWQGGQDRMVPFEHGRWLAENIPGSRAHLHPDDGHLSLWATGLSRIMDDLLALSS
jgi:pimeloyl-ACP methyl ester carboxylesterase